MRLTAALVKGQGERASGRRVLGVLGLGRGAEVGVGGSQPEGRLQVSVTLSALPPSPVPELGSLGPGLGWG